MKKRSNLCSTQVFPLWLLWLVVRVQAQKAPSGPRPESPSSIHPFNNRPMPFSADITHMAEVSTTIQPQMRDTKNYEDDNKPIPVYKVDAVIGGKAELPCNIDPADPTDDVYLVLWYRHEAGKPLYSFDVRGRNSEDGKHWSANEPFGNRAFFRVGTDPTFLLINEVRLEDEDVYRCRVDYRNSPTKNVKLNLTVVVPPNSPRIISEDRRVDTSKAIAGIYQEDDAMRLKCDVVGGRPLPAVSWWINGQMVDNTSYTEGRDTVVNRLMEMKAERHLDGAQIECRASNNKVSQPQSRILEIKINLRPVSVAIIQKPEFVKVGEEYELVCQAFGSKPQAIITWYKGREPIHDEMVTSHYQANPEVTNSLLKYRPRRADNGKRITCRAENPAMPNSALEDSLLLSVMYPPLIQLSLGRSIGPEEIKERDDVYFECDIRANPPIQTIEWHHNGRQLEHNLNRGVILSNQSLVIQRVSRSDAGEYICRADNAHGAGKSNPVELSVKYRPVCQHGAESPQFGVVEGGNVTLTCDVLSHPPVRRFRWWFNNSGGKAVEIRPEDIRSNGSSSMIAYSPQNEMDYGSVSCMAINALGRQQHPCSFVISPATKPRRPENCNILNSTNPEGEEVIDLKCVSAYGGGLETNYILEIYDTKTNRLRHNFTSKTSPHFIIRDLRGLHPLRFRLYAVNARGMSEDSEIPVVMVNKPEKHTDTVSLSTGINTDSIVLVVCGLAIALLIVLFFAGLIVHRRQGLSSKKLLDCQTANQNDSPNAKTPDQPNPNSNYFKNQQQIPDPDPRGKNAVSSFNPDISQPKIDADLGLQSRVIDPRSSDALTQQTKPILKPSLLLNDNPTPPYNKPPVDAANAGNWYPNPMDQDAAVWIAREHGQYYYPSSGGTLPNKRRAQDYRTLKSGIRNSRQQDLYPKSNTLNRRRPPVHPGPFDVPMYQPHPGTYQEHLGRPPTSSSDSRRLRYNSSVRDLETDKTYLLHGEEKISQNILAKHSYLEENIHV